MNVLLALPSHIPYFFKSEMSLIARCSVSLCAGRKEHIANIQRFQVMSCSERCLKVTPCGFWIVRAAFGRQCRWWGDWHQGRRVGREVGVRCCTDHSAVEGAWFVYRAAVDGKTPHVTAIGHIDPNTSKGVDPCVEIHTRSVTLPPSHRPGKAEGARPRGVF